MSVDHRPSGDTGASPQFRRHPAKLGVKGNERLTSSTALVLFALLAVEGFTVLRIGPLLSVHVFVGMLLIPPVVLKLASTMWRFGKYYSKSPEYVQKGPPPPILRLLGPFVVVLTVVLFGTGVALVVGPHEWRGQLLVLHRASFLLWFGCMTIHVIGHAAETVHSSLRDWSRVTRRRVTGSTARRLAVVASVIVGVALALVTAPHAAHWFLGSR